jgi:hypothetical protein
MKRAQQWVVILLLSGAILGLVEAQFHIVRGLFGAPSLSSRELAMQVLGAHLASAYPGKKVLVLSNPFSTQPGQKKEVYDFEKAGLRGLKKGLGKAEAVEQVVYPEIRPQFYKDRRSVWIDPATCTPLSYIVTEDSLDKETRQHPGAEILVSLIGLPLNVTTTETWKRSARFALLLPDLRMVGDQAAIRQAFRSGKIAAAVLNKPGAPPDEQRLGSDPQAEFDLRFLLVTPETVDQYLKAYPKLF